MEWTSCAVVYTVSYGLSWSCHGLVRSNTVSHGLVRSLIRLYTDMAPVSIFKSFKNQTRLSRIHSNGPSVTRIRPRLVRLYVRFTRMVNHISRVFCVRQALGYWPFQGGGSVVVVVSLFIVAPICVGVLCLVLVLLFSSLCPSSFAINGEERELVALL